MPPASERMVTSASRWSYSPASRVRTSRASISPGARPARSRPRSGWPRRPPPGRARPSRRGRPAGTAGSSSRSTSDCSSRQPRRDALRVVGWSSHRSGAATSICSSAISARLRVRVEDRLDRGQRLVELGEGCGKVWYQPQPVTLLTPASHPGRRTDPPPGGPDQRRTLGPRPKPRRTDDRAGAGHRHRRHQDRRGAGRRRGPDRPARPSSRRVRSADADEVFAPLAAAGITELLEPGRPSAPRSGSVRPGRSTDRPGPSRRSTSPPGAASRSCARTAGGGPGADRDRAAGRAGRRRPLLRPR